MSATSLNRVDDERECIICGLLVSDCVCDDLTRLPTREQLERQRSARLTRAELASASRTIRPG